MYSLYIYSCYISNYYRIQKFKDLIEETAPEIKEKKEIFVLKKYVMFWGKLISSNCLKDIEVITLGHSSVIQLPGGNWGNLNVSLHWLMEKTMGKSPKAPRERKLDPKTLHPLELLIQNIYNRKAYVKKEKQNPWWKMVSRSPFWRLFYINTSSPLRGNLRRCGKSEGTSVNHEHIYTKNEDQTMLWLQGINISNLKVHKITQKKRNGRRNRRKYRSINSFIFLKRNSMFCKMLWNVQTGEWVWRCSLCHHMFN